MKHYILIGITIFITLIAVTDYYFGFHTYFQKTEVHDPLPKSINLPEADISYKTIVQGSFVEVDLIHKGSGTARIIEGGDKRYLRLEDFEVTNGPDLYVYLSESKTPGNNLKSIDKYISLGLLKGNAGNQNYDIPKPFQGYDTVVIWCQKFGVLFTYAVME